MIFFFYFYLYSGFVIKYAVNEYIKYAKFQGRDISNQSINDGNKHSKWVSIPTFIKWFQIFNDFLRYIFPFFVNFHYHT